MPSISQESNLHCNYRLGESLSVLNVFLYNIAFVLHIFVSIIVDHYFPHTCAGNIINLGALCIDLVIGPLL